MRGNNTVVHTHSHMPLWHFFPAMQLNFAHSNSWEYFPASSAGEDEKAAGIRRNLREKEVMAASAGIRLFPAAVVSWG